MADKNAAGAGHRSESTVLTVKVIPRSSRTQIAGTMADGTLKVRVAAVPEDGVANEELCRFLARHYGVGRESVAIVSGQTSTRKVIRISGITLTAGPTESH